MKFLDGRFLAPRVSGGIYLSFNGWRWVNSGAPSKNWLDVCYGAGKFMAFASDRYPYFSDDARTWTAGPITMIGATQTGGCAFDSVNRMWAVCSYSADSTDTAVRVMKDGGSEWLNDAVQDSTPVSRAAAHIAYFCNTLITACDYNPNQSGSVSGITITQFPTLKRSTRFVHFINSSYQPSRVNTRYYTGFCLAETPVQRKLIVGCSTDQDVGELYWTEDGVRWNRIVPDLLSGGRSIACVGFG